MHNRFILYLLVKSNDTIVFLEDKMPEMPIITKLLYGGLTEEIIVRWGWLSLFLYIINKILKKQKPSEFIAILLSSVLFGISHLPVVFQNMGDSINFYLIVYIIVFNTILGIIFGRLFLKYNIETAMFCHIFFHIFSLIFNIFFYEKL